MAGMAKTSAFMIGSATVMIGPQSALYDLNPTDHGIGLVKNFQVSAEATMAELTQGVRSTMVYSVLTQNRVRASCEVFEYSARNLTYALGLDGSTMQPMGNIYTLSAQIVGNNGTPVTQATFINATDVSATFAQGDWVMIQGDVDDLVHLVKLSAATTVSGTAPNITHTLTFTGYGVKGGMTFPVGSRIMRANRVDVGSPADMPFFSCKVIGIMPEQSRPMGILFPKIRVTRGFTLAFTNNDFGNMPFEFQPYDLLPSDPGFADFRNRGAAMVLNSH